MVKFIKYQSRQMAHSKVDCGISEACGYMNAYVMRVVFAL
jgi:hypothetical protein